MILLTLLFFVAVFFFVSWLVMLLVEPATAGAYSVDYIQAMAIVALVSLLFSGSAVGRRD